MGRVLGGVVKATVVGMAVTVVLAAAVTPASAGGGVQVAVCSSAGKHGDAVISGWNQHGEFTSSPTVRYDGNGCGILWNWWWTGSRVNIHYTNRGENYRSATCDISRTPEGQLASCYVA